MKFILLKAVVIGVCLTLSMTAKAGLITGFGDILTDPDLITGTVIDFESTPDGPFDSLEEGNLTLTAFGPATSQTIYAGVFNTQGRYLTSGVSTVEFEFSFTSSVDFLAFNIGASDFIWTLTAYQNSLELESIAVAPVRGSMRGEYVGIRAQGMTRVVFKQTTSPFPGYVDDIFLDNVVYGAAKIPEPSTLAIFALGMIGLASCRFKKQS